MIKFSTYNISYIQDEEYFIFNTISGKIIILNEKDFNNIFVLKCENEINKYKEVLFKNHFIVDVDCDENEIITEKCNYYLNKTLEVTILVTENCNFKCIYCYEKHTSGQMSELVQKSIIKFINNKIDNYNVLRVEWFGGEPLLEIDLIEQLSNHFLEMCKRKGKGYYAAITTNAYLLTYDNFRKLKRCRVLSYQITIDGIKETHDAQRMLVNGNKTFDIILNNLLNIKNKSKSRLFEFLIRTNASKFVLPHISEYLENMSILFGDDNRFKFIMTYIKDYGGEKIDNITDILCSAEDIDYLRKHSKETDIKRKQERLTHLVNGKYMCYAGNPSSFVFNIKGECLKCTVGLYEPNNNVGYLNEEGGLELNYEKFNLWTSGNSKFDKKCNECKLIPLCFERMCPYMYIRRDSDGQCKLTADSVMREAIEKLKYVILYD